MAMTKQFKKTQWNNDREPAITAEQLNRMEKGIDDNDTRIVELDKAVTANKTAGDKSLEEVNKTLQKHTEDIADVNEELTSQGKAIGELADKKITKFYSSSQGDSTLSDSDDGKMQDMMLYGKSEQKQYSGYQLISEHITSDGTYNELTYTSEGMGAIKVIGTNASTNADNKFRVFTLTGVTGKYTVSSKSTDTNISFRSIYNNKWHTSGTFDMQPTDTLLIWLNINGGATVNGTIKIMLEKGETAHSYEPYVGGIPSPNPDYPQEIKSVVEPVVKVTGKNLLDFSLFNNSSSSKGITCTVKSDDTGRYFLLNGTATADTDLYIQKTKFAFQNDENITISINPAMTAQYYLATNNNIGFNNKTFASCKAIELKYFYIHVLENAVLNNYKLYIQIEKGSTATSYEPYTAQSVPLTGITLNAIPVSSGGNVTIGGQQYISDYVDVERGKIVRMCKEIILNGSEGWIEENDNQVESHRMHSKISEKAISTGNANAKVGAMCSHFIEKTPVETWVKSQSAFSIQNGGALQFRKIGILTVVDWKSWLSENNITVYYPLATPTEESLSEELAEKLKALQTYYPQTNIFITSNQLDGYAIFNYPISLANGWNYVKQQIGDTRDYIYDMDLQMAQAYVNSEYAVALTELEV